MDLASNLLLSLARDARSRGAAAPGGSFPPPAGLACLAPARPLRELVASLLARGGPAAVVGLGQGVGRLGFTPALHLLESHQGMDDFIRRWSALEGAWQVRHRTSLRVEGDALVIRSRPWQGQGAAPGQTLMVAGAMRGLLDQCGYAGLGLAIARGAGPWEDPAGLPGQRPGRDSTGADTGCRISWTRRQPVAPAFRKASQAPGAVALALQAIDRDPGGAWTPRRLADHLNRSPRSLDRHLAVSGTSAALLLRQARLRSACMAMAATDQSLTGIAHEVGFSDAAHLSRSFREACGMSPSAWRLLLVPGS